MRKKEKTTQGPRQVLATSSKVLNDEKYFVEILVANVTLNAFVDFGSSVMLLNRSTADKLNALTPSSYHNECIRGYGGGVVRTLGKTAPLRLELGECTAELEFLVVPDEVQAIPVIVGQSFTELPDVVVIKDAETLQFLRKRPADGRGKLRAAEATIIPPNHIGFVRCVSDVTGDLYVEESVRCKEGEECAIPRCVLRIETSGSCRVPVLNLAAEEIIIKEATTVAMGQSCRQAKKGDQKDVSTREREPLTEMDINIDDALPNEQRKELPKILNEYRDCFALKLQEIGCAADTEMNLAVTSEKPITYRPYKMAYSERPKVKKMIRELKDADLIRDSTSEYASPIILVRKPNGDQRLCVDYRKLNAVTHKERHPLPLIDDQLDRLKDFQYFTTLDLFSGYYQIKMAETAIDTHDGHYELKRMPFGLANGPSVFQRVINRVLGPLDSTIATAYLDDILSPTKTVEEELQNLRKILNELRANNLTLNPSKCHFFKSSITYLGFEVTKNGARPGERKVTAVADFPTPKNVHQVRQFLGLTGFFRRFIPKHAPITKPLTEMLQKGAKWNWTHRQAQAFQDLKTKLKLRPLLGIYDEKAPVELHIDASQIGIAGIMLQPNSEGVLQPILYFSRKLTTAEAKWHSFELETLAVLETLKRFRVYLLGKEFKVKTDCQSLKMASEKRDLVPRIARWWLQLQEFTFNVEQRAGTKMLHVDALSRNPVEPAGQSATLSEHYVLRIQPEDWVLAMQMTDDKLEAIHKILEKPATDHYARSIHKEYRLKDNRVYKKEANKELWLVPQGMRREVVRANHDEMGHFSVEKTLDKLKEAYWFPKMRQYVT